MKESGHWQIVGRLHTEAIHPEKEGAENAASETVLSEYFDGGTLDALSVSVCDA